MGISSKLDQLHAKVRQNRWHGYFATFIRIILALGFFPSGLTKVMGERFTALAVNHPMGYYLEALHTTGYYYTFIGILQVLASILLLIPRTALLGALIYFPIILNICILSLAVRFDGSLFTAPLMVLANLYLLCWDYHKLKFILPFHHSTPVPSLTQQPTRSNKFPIKFFSGVFATMLLVVVVVTNVYDLYPRNTITECKKQCPGDSKSEACYEFCDCIHQEGQTLSKCLEGYHQAQKVPSK